MTHQIIIAAFKKAVAETEKNSTHANAEFLSEYIFEKFKYSISTKSLTRYYKGESSPNQKVKDYLAQYLGYESYDIYIKWNSTSSQKDEQEEKKKSPREEMIATEISNFKSLFETASRWHKSQYLRNYIQESENYAIQTNSLNEEKLEWINWAREKADWYDPFIEKEIDLLKDVDRNKI